MKSFILSLTVTALICFFFMSVFEAKANVFYKNLANRYFIIIAIFFFACYVLTLFWGIRNIAKSETILNLMGIGLSIIGLSIYAFGYIMNTGNGKASAGQFDHTFNKIEVTQRNALKELMQQTNTADTELQFINYWQMHKNANGFVVCVQQGNIIALQVKDKQINNINTISKLQHLNWLVLENCELKTIATLNLPKLERLAINDNQITSLAGFEHEPNVTWLNFKNNPIIDSAALQFKRNKEIYILN